jgi:hypothetical protein
MVTAPFTFDAEGHVYADFKGRVPSITQLLNQAGEIDDTWFTEESSERGRHVHQLTAEYDLGGIDDDDVREMVSGYKNYLIAHVCIVKATRPTWLHVETPAVHPTLRFGGRCDRLAKVYRAAAVWEVKSGVFQKSHPLQTALQAILSAPTFKLPPERIVRYCCYLGENGRPKLEEHRNRRDFAKAREIIKRYA